MDRLESMKVFVSVVDEGGFAAASRALNISASSVTKLIADLEAHLGTRLLNRTTRKLVLTTAGTIYLERLRFILQELDETEQLTLSLNQETRGVLKIMTTPILADHVLAPCIAQFRQDYPNILLDIEASSRPTQNIEQYDLTLMPTDENFDGNIIARRIATSESILVASPAYLKYRGLPLEPDDLLNHCLLHLKVNNQPVNRWSLFRADDVETRKELQIKPVLWSNNIATLLMASIDHVGIACVPIDLIRSELQEGRLTKILDPWIAGRTHLYAAFPSNKFIPKKTSLFVDFLTQMVRLQLHELQVCSLNQ